MHKAGEGLKCFGRPGVLSGAGWWIAAVHALHQHASHPRGGERVATIYISLKLYIFMYGMLYFLTLMIIVLDYSYVVFSIS